MYVFLVEKTSKPFPFALLVIYLFAGIRTYFGDYFSRSSVLGFESSTRPWTKVTTEKHPEFKNNMEGEEHTVQRLVTGGFWERAYQMTPMP